MENLSGVLNFPCKQVFKIQDLLETVSENTALSETKILQLSFIIATNPATWACKNSVCSYNKD